MVESGNLQWSAKTCVARLTAGQPTAGWAVGAGSVTSGTAERVICPTGALTQGLFCRWRRVP